MLCKISNNRETVVINNFKHLDEAKKCFPESVVEACNEIIDYSSYNEYIKSLINKINPAITNTHTNIPKIIVAIVLLSTCVPMTLPIILIII